MKQINNLVIEGGGFKSFACIGSIKYIEQESLFDNIQNFAGSSSGSIICFLLVCGFNSDEIKDFIFSKNWNKVFKDNFFRKMYNIVTRYGLNNGNEFMKNIESFIKKRGISSNVTFKELHEITGKVLVITGTNLNTSKICYFSHKHNPEMKILTSIRISMSIPYFLTSVKYNDEYYVDGGILMNFPLYYFDLDKDYKLCSSNTNLPTKELCDKVFLCDKGLQDTLGIWVLEKNKQKNNIDYYNGYIPIKDPSSYSQSILSALFINSEKLYIKENFWERIISIELPFDISFTEFNPDSVLKNELYNIGYKSAQKYFEGVNC
jgi:predicted acylesterase/phospholipase RssA